MINFYIPIIVLILSEAFMLWYLNGIDEYEYSKFPIVFGKIPLINGLICAVAVGLSKKTQYNFITHYILLILLNYLEKVGGKYDR